MAEASLGVIIYGRGKDLINEFQKIGHEAEKSGKATHSGWSKAASAVKMAGAAIAGTAVAVGISSIHMADSFEKAHGRLKVAADNAGEGWDGISSVVKKATDAGVKFGYTATDIEGALAQLETSTGSVTTSVKYLAIAQDLAAYKGISLADAAIVVTKASQGQLKPLKALAIDLPVAAGGALKTKKAYEGLAKAGDAMRLVQEKIHMGLLKGPQAVLALQAAQGKLTAAQSKLSSTQATGTTILDALTKKMGGQASEQSKTFEGRTKALKAELGNLQIKIGMALMPVLIKLVGWVTTAIHWFEKHKTVGKALAIVVGVILVAAITAMTAAWVADAVAVIAATWPILAIIAAVALLAAGIIYAWTHWDQIWTWIMHHKAYAVLLGVLFPIIAAILGIIGAVKFVQAHWSTIWGAITNTVEVAHNLIMDFLNPIIAVLHAIVDAAHAVGDALGSIHMPHISLPHIHIPGFATGGVVPGPIGAPMLATVHGGETITPPGGGSTLVRSRGGGGDTYSPNITVNMNGPSFGTSAQIGRFLADALIQYERKNGKRWIAQVTP